MKKRMLIVIAGLVVLIAGLGFFKYRQIQAAIKGGAWTPPPEAVTTTVATEAQWEGTLHAIGSATAVNGVVVSADLPGVVSSIEFESGRAVKKGAVLVRLDTRTERAQLASAVARRDLAKLDFDRVTHLREQNANSQADLDRAGAEAKQAEAAVAELQAVIERKTIRAPFAGVLGIRQVNLGQYLAGGDPVVPLQSMDPVYVNFSLPQQDVAALHVGAAVSVTADSVGGLDGRIT